jgi:hypothetical protein
MIECAFRVDMFPDKGEYVVDIFYWQFSPQPDEMNFLAKNDLKWPTALTMDRATVTRSNPFHDKSPDNGLNAIIIII